MEYSFKGMIILSLFRNTESLTWGLLYARLGPGILCGKLADSGLDVAVIKFTLILDSIVYYL